MPAPSVKGVVIVANKPEPKMRYAKGVVEKITPKAILVEVQEFEDMDGKIQKGGGNKWFPMSQIEIPGTLSVGDGDEVELEVPDWLMKAKELE